MLLASSDTMRRRGWGAVQLLLLVLPCFAAALLALLLVLMWVAHCLTARGKQDQNNVEAWLPRQRPSRQLLAAAVCTLSLAAECVALGFNQPGLPLAHILLLLSTRYFCWRFLFNAISYAHASCASPGGISAPLAKRGIVRATSELSTTLIAAHALAADAAVGLLLQLPLLLVALMPLSTPLHFFCLFRMSGAEVHRKTANASQGYEDLKKSSERGLAEPKAPKIHARGLSSRLILSTRLNMSRFFAPKISTKVTDDSLSQNSVTEDLAEATAVAEIDRFLTRQSANI